MKKDVRYRFVIDMASLNRPDHMGEQNERLSQLPK